MYSRQCIKYLPTIILLSTMLCCITFHAVAEDAAKGSEKTLLNDKIDSPLRVLRCPECETVLQERSFSHDLHSVGHISNDAGAGTCSKCGSMSSRADLKGNKYGPKFKSR